jgi:hypothetical protein
MNLRIVLILSCSILSACSGLSSGRGIPAPVESRDGSATMQGSEIVEVQEVQPATQVPDGAQPPVLMPSAPEDSVGPEDVRPASPATPSSTLLAAVDAAVAVGDLERAAALCERALRISPRDGYLWLRLATIRAQQGRRSEAAGFARRALSFATTDVDLENQINGLLMGLE